MNGRSLPNFAPVSRTGSALLFGQDWFGLRNFHFPGENTGENNQIQLGHSHSHLLALRRLVHLVPRFFGPRTRVPLQSELCHCRRRIRAFTFGVMAQILHELVSHCAGSRSVKPSRASSISVSASLSFCSIQLSIDSSQLQRAHRARWIAS